MSDFILKVKNLNIVLALIVLVLSFGFGAQAQVDCNYGFRIYARDEAGHAIQNAKLRVAPSSGKYDLISHRLSLIDKNGVYSIYGLETENLKAKGNFLLEVSAAGFETYEGRFHFPVCETQIYELKLRPAGSIAKAEIERLFTVHGKVFDEEMKPFGNAKVEATFADGRVYQTESNAYGYFKFDLPKGVANIRVTNSRIPDIVFDNYKIEKNYSVLNVPVCLKCQQKESKK